MQLGFVGLGAVVETAYLPALRRLYGHAVHCFGFDVLPTGSLKASRAALRLRNFSPYRLILSLLPPHRCTILRCWNRP
jgi:hypothetical protein